MKEENLIHVKERKQSIEANTKMFHVLELSERDFSYDQYVERMNYMCEQMRNFIRDMDIFIKSNGNERNEIYVTRSEEFI